MASNNTTVQYSIYPYIIFIPDRYKILAYNWIKITLKCCNEKLIHLNDANILLYLRRDINYTLSLSLDSYTRVLTVVNKRGRNTVIQAGTNWTREIFIIL